MRSDERWQLYVDPARDYPGGKPFGTGPAQLRATLIDLYDRGVRSALIEYRDDGPMALAYTFYLTRTSNLLNRFTRWTLREKDKPSEPRRLS